MRGDDEARAARAATRTGLTELLRMRLAELPRIGRSELRRPARGRRRSTLEPSYAEDEVRDRIYGWHSGSVEPPEPLDPSRCPLAKAEQSVHAR